MKTLAVILPAYNEDQIIGKVIKQLKQDIKDLKINKKIIVVNDGSSDKTAVIAKKHGALVLTHRINRGLGAALATGLEYSRRIQADFVITMDSDGQHDSQDLEKILQPLLKHKADVVVGSRFLNKNNKIPFIRTAILKFANFVTFLFFGIWTSDSQSGFRGFNRKAIEKINLSTNSMEVSSEFYAEVKKHKLKFTEIPIKVRYTEYSLSKGQQDLNSFNVMLKLIYKLFR